MRTKIKSFTLAELLVVMIITAIVVGIAFSVLRMIQKQVFLINKNLDKNTELTLFEQKMWQDFNKYHLLKFNNRTNTLLMISELDSVTYYFEQDLIMRDKDTIPLKLEIQRILYNGSQVEEGEIDAISIGCDKEFPYYNLFIFKKNDPTSLINTNGI